MGTKNVARIGRYTFGFKKYMHKIRLNVGINKSKYHLIYDLYTFDGQNVIVI
jgi:hypothetical protein